MSIMMRCLQDGSERVIESLSLIDAVMPDVVESRKLAAAKQAQLQSAEQAPVNGSDESNRTPAG